jgi:hypothetical protein|tara:strand:+ start:747 stop:1418 length:672 start_codon:yes stop_codon:yes gene_type:complete
MAKRLSLPPNDRSRTGGVDAAGAATRKEVKTIMKGHNSAPFRSKILGTGLTPPNVLTALIYRPDRSSHTSSPIRRQYWILGFDSAQAPTIELLMGWTATDVPYSPIRLTFPDLDSAIAQRNGSQFIVRTEPDKHRSVPPGRFWWERVPTSKGAGAPGAHRIVTGHRPSSRQRLHRRIGAASVCDRTAELAMAADPDSEASAASFPASDPPAWIGATVYKNGRR